MANTADMAQVYDQGAHNFQAQAPGLLSWQGVGRRALVEVLTPTLAQLDLSTAQVLDEGSASGRIVELLMQLGVPASNITGVEISPKQVELAREDPRFKGVTFEVGNIATDSLPADRFDVATQHMVAEHLDNDQLRAADRNTYQALKPGGVFVMVCTHPDRVQHTEGDKIQPDGSYVTTFPWGGEGNNYARPVEEHVTALTDVGFEVDHVAELALPDYDEAAAIDRAAAESYRQQGYWDVNNDDPEQHVNGQRLNTRLVVVAHKPAATAPEATEAA